MFKEDILISFVKLFHSDYLQMGIMDYLNRPEFLELAAVVDPYSYRDRLVK